MPGLRENDIVMEPRLQADDIVAAGSPQAVDSKLDDLDKTNYEHLDAAARFLATFEDSPPITAEESARVRRKVSSDDDGALMTDRLATAAPDGHDVLHATAGQIFSLVCGGL